MNRLNLRSSFALVLLLALILPVLAACGGPATTPPTTNAPTAATGGTPATAVPAAPTAAEAPTAATGEAPTAATGEAPTAEAGTGGTAKDTIIVGTWQEPGSFIDYANSQAIQVEISLIFRPRLVTRRDFKFQPNPTLVDGDLPTFENGGAKQVDVTVKPGDPYFDVASKSVISGTKEVTLKQLVVTGKIKSGLKWDDGEPFTAKDFIFAWKLNCSPDSEANDLTYCPIGSAPGAGGLVTNYVAKDDTTLELSLVPGAIDPTYQILVFGPEGAPQPEHQFPNVKASDYVKDERATGGANAVPLGFGPYKMKEWVKGDHITFVPNPNWTGAAPKTPNITYRFYSDSVALASALIGGDVDASSAITGLSIDQYPYLVSVQKNGDIKLEIDKNAASFEMLYINFDDPKDKTLKAPNPLLSDFKVRKAIAMALNRKQMVDTIFFGQSSVVEQPHLPQMISYDPTQGTIAFDPDGAKKLLDEAGWVPGADGIRVKNGVKASFTILTTSGNSLRQKSTQIMQSNLKDVGINVDLNYQPSSVTFSKDGLYGRAFEAIEFANVFSVVDPGGWWYGLASCDQIPSPENNLAGNNFAGWCDKEASDAVSDANFVTLDETKRKADWEVALKKYFENGYPLIPLFIRPNITGFAPNLDGAHNDSTEYFTWNVETWSLTE
jgi:peptide/nickel transport system substrate-binding protein